MVMRVREVAVCALFPAMLAVGCGDGMSRPTDAGMGWLELGTGEWEYVPVEDGQEVDFVPGSQGGYHIYVSFRAGDVDPDGTEFTITTEVLDRPGSESGSEIHRDLVTTQEPGAYEYIGWPAQIPMPGCAEGRLVEVVVSLVDRHGVTAIDDRVVVPRATIEPPPCP